MSSEPVYDVEALAAIVSEVTQTIFESDFNVVAATAPSQPFDAAVTLTMQGAPSYLLTIAWRAKDESAIQAKFTQVAHNAGSAPPVSDILGETLNIVAGQIKSRGALEHRLGLPQRAHGHVGVTQQSSSTSAAILLKSQNAEIWMDVAYGG